MHIYVVDVVVVTYHFMQQQQQQQTNKKKTPVSTNKVHSSSNITKTNKSLMGQCSHYKYSE